MKTIIFPSNGGLTSIYPTGAIPLIEVARKDVPFGTPFLYAESSELPTDLVFRDAWTADFSNPDGYGIGPQRWFIEKAQEQIDAGINVEKNEALIQQMKDEVFQLEGIRL